MIHIDGHGNMFSEGYTLGNYEDILSSEKSFVEDFFDSENSMEYSNMEEYLCYSEEN